MQIRDSVRNFTSRPALYGLFVAFVTMTFVSIAFNLPEHGWLSWYHLAVSSQEVHGRITGRQPKDHQTCYFEYTVNSVKYEGADEGCHFEVGELVTLKYLPADPSLATTASPVEQFVLMAIVPIALAIFGGFGAAWQAYRRKSKNEPHGSDGS